MQTDPHGSGADLSANTNPQRLRKVHVQMRERKDIEEMLAGKPGARQTGTAEQRLASDLMVDRGELGRVLVAACGPLLENSQTPDIEHKMSQLSRAEIQFLSISATPTGDAACAIHPFPAPIPMRRLGTQGSSAHSLNVFGIPIGRGARARRSPLTSAPQSCRLRTSSATEMRWWVGSDS